MAWGKRWHKYFQKGKVEKPSEAQADDKVYPGCEITGDTLEFILAMDRFKQRKPYPDCRDVLNVLKSLGYVKVQDGNDKVHL